MSQSISENAAQKLPLQSVGVLLYNSLRSSVLDKVILVDNSTGEQLTNREFLKMTIIIAQKLKQVGIEKGNVVTIVSQNSMKYLATVIAGFYIGAQMNLLNPDYLTGELKPLLSISQPRIIFCTKKSLPQLLKLSLPTPIINYDDENFNDFLQIEEDENFVPEDLQLEDIALVMASSGTTGLPKCVLLTHNNVRGSLIYFGSQLSSFSKEDTVLGLLPFFHIYGFTIVLSRIFYGNRVVVMEKFVPDKFLQAIQDYRIRKLYTVPPMIQFFLKSPLVEKYDLSSVTELSCGAATLTEDIEEAVKRKLNLQSVRQGYGLTETTAGIIMMPLHETRFGSIGKICTGNEVRICDVETGKVLPANQVGELRFKGNLVMKGYLGNEEATRAAFDEKGFLKSGDLGYFDDEGFYFIVGRLKEIIKYKGFQVSPSEIESILFQHPAVEDCAVIGVPNEESGEVPLAFVVKRANEDASEEELVGYVNGQVSVHKRLHGGVRFITQIPKSSSGKILRRKLQELI